MTEKLKYAHLAAMHFLIDGKEGTYRFAASGRSFSRLAWHAVDGKTDEGKFLVRRLFQTEWDASPEDKAAAQDSAARFADRLGGSADVDFTALIRLGYVQSGCALFSKAAEDFLGKLEASGLDQRDQIHRPTREGRMWWESEGRSLYEAAAAKRAQQRASVGRTVLIGEPSVQPVSLPESLAGRWPKGLRLPVPERATVRPAYTATVIKETEQRLYLADVAEVNTGRPQVFSPVIQGRRPKQYVDRQFVIADHVDAEAVGRLVRIDEEARSDFQEACVKAVEEMLPHVERLWARADQQEAMREDMAREALAELEARRSPSGPTPRRR